MAENKENLLIEVGVSDKAAGPLGEIGREVERLSAVIEKAFAPKTTKTEFERQGETAEAARALLEGYTAKLAEERTLIGLSADDRQVAIARRNAEAVAIKGGITDHAALVDAVEREVRANQSLTASLQAQVAQQAESAQADARRVAGLREDITARSSHKAQLDALIPSIVRERELMRLTANERQVAIARRTAEDLAIRAGITDRAQLLAAIEREVRESQKLKQSLGGVDTASAQAASALGRLGFTVAHGLGPAGNVVYSVGSQLIAAAGGADALALKAGLSAASLTAVSFTAAGIVAVGGALVFAAKGAAGLDEALAGVLLRSRGGADALESYKETVKAIAAQTGEAKNEIALGLSQAFEAGADSQEEAVELLATGVKAKLLGFGDSAAEAIGVLDPALDGLRKKIADSKGLLADLFVGAQRGSAGFATFAKELASVSIVATDLGVDSRRLIADLAQLTNESDRAEGVGQQMALLFQKLADKSDPLHIRLEELGVDLSRNTIASQGFLQTFAKVQEQLSKPGREGIQDELFSSVRIGRVALTALKADVGSADETLRQLEDSITRASEAYADILSQPGRQLSATEQRVKNFFSGIGELALKSAADLAGDKAPIPIGVKLTADIKDLQDEIRRALAEGDVAAAIEKTADLERIGKEAGERYADARAKAIRDHRIDPQSELAGVKQPELYKGVAQDIAASQLDPLAPFNKAIKESDDHLRFYEGRLQKLTGLVSFFAAGIKQTFEDVSFTDYAAALGDTSELGPVTVPVEVSPTAQPGKIARTIDDLLAQVPIIAFEIPLAFDAPPEAIERAQETLTAIRKKIADSGESNLNAKDKEALDAATEALTRYASAQKDLGAITASLQARSLTGTDRQRAENEALYKQVEAQIAQAIRFGASVTEVASAFGALANLKVADAKLADDTALRQVNELEAAALALRAQSVEKAAQLHRTIGDVVRADRLDVDAIQARADASRVAANLELEARRLQLAGNAEAIAAAEDLYRLKLEQIDADREGARLALQRAASERSRAQRSEISGLEVDLLSGLDQELAAIERNRDARAQAANAEAGQFQEAARALNQKLGLLDLVAARDAAAAKLAAAGQNFDAIVTAVREVSDAYGFQAIAIHATREAERDRLEAALRGSNLEQAALNLTLALHDQATAKIKAAAAAQAALVPASVLAEIKLLQDAFEKAGGASLDFGTATVEQMQKVLDATLAAKNGMEALTAGLKAGAEDAKRVFADDLAFGIKAGSDQLFAFRDAAAEAFASIGEGSSVLRDFVTANLKALQQNISLIAANKLSSAIFGKPEGNKAAGVDPSLALQDAGHVLSFAGNELTKAAQHLASITFGPGSPSAVALTPQPEPLAFGVSGPPVAGSENFVGPIPEQAGADAIVAGAQAAGQIAITSSEQAGTAFVGAFGGSVSSAVTDKLLASLGPVTGEAVTSGAAQAAQAATLAAAFAPVQVALFTLQTSLLSVPVSIGITEAALATLPAAIFIADEALFTMIGPSFAVVAGFELASIAAINLAASLAAAAGGTTLKAALGFQHGGYLPGTPIRTLYPKSNAFGGVYSQRTLIEVAEVPGKTEAVVPLVGGEIPVTIKGPGGGAGGAGIAEMVGRLSAQVDAVQASVGPLTRAGQPPIDDRFDGLTGKALGPRGGQPADTSPTPRRHLADTSSPLSPAIEREILATSQGIDRLIGPAGVFPPGLASARPGAQGPSPVSGGSSIESILRESTRSIDRLSETFHVERSMDTIRQQGPGELAERAGAAIQAKREARERDEREDRRRDGGRAVHVGGPRIEISMPITIDGSRIGNAADFAKEVLALAPMLRKEFSRAVTSGADRDAINAIRDAAGK